MTRRLGPTPADDIGADLEPVWDRLASHADAAPAASPELTARVQGALLDEFDRALRPTVHRPPWVLRPLVRTGSLRSLVAAAALVALLGASVALAGAGVARLNQVPAVSPTPAVEESDEPDDTPDAPAPIIQPPARPGPDGIEDPDEDDDDADDEDRAETDEPEDEDRPEADEDDEDHASDDEPSDSPDDEPEADEPD